MESQTELQKQNQKKWIYEEIVEKIPPFRWLPPVWDVIAQLLLVEAIGVLAFVYFEMPLKAAILGTLAIAYTVIWSAGCLNVIPWVRQLKDPSNIEERKVLQRYKKRLLLDRRYELFGGVVSFLGILFLVFMNVDALQSLLGNGLRNPLLWVLIVVLAWDVGYRIGLSLMTTFLAALRSIQLSRATRERRGLEYTAYSELRTLKKLDSVNLYWGASAILLIPVASIAPLMLYGLLFCLAAILGLSALSLMAMDTVPWFPPDVESILYNERFAYVALCWKKQTHVTPVIFVYYGKYLYFGISVVSAKYRILRKNPKIAVLVDMRDKRNPLKNRAVLLRGKATLLGELNLLGLVRLYLYGLWMLLVRAIFSQKYPQYMKYYKVNIRELPLAWQNKPFVSRVMVRVNVERAIFWRKARPTHLRV